MSLCPNDAALAVTILTDEVTADIPYVSRQQMDADITKAAAEQRNLVTSVMKLHGLNQIGDADEGDEVGAQQIVDAAKRFQADPTGYTNALFGDGSTDDNTPAADPVEIDAPVTSTDVIAPSFSLQQAAHVAPVTQPVAKIRFVPRPASALFPGISSTYSSDLVPTAVWESPKPVIEEPDQDFQFNGYNVAIMAMALEERKNVIATGDPGCGKTEFFKQFGRRVGLPVTKVPFDGNLTRAEIIGSFRQVATPNGSETPFVLGLIPRLIQQPGIIILDEIDQADPDISYMLHPVYEGEGLTIQEEGGTLIPRHPHCYIVATANTKGRGSDNGLTHARFEMSEATRDRFPYWLNFTFMKPDQEAATITAKTGLDLALAKDLVKVANMIRTAYGTGEMSQTCSLRQMLDVVPAYRRFAARGEKEALALGIETVMAGRANNDDAAGIREFTKQAISVDLVTLER